VGSNSDLLLSTLYGLNFAPRDSSYLLNFCISLETGAPSHCFPFQLISTKLRATEHDRRIRLSEYQNMVVPNARLNIFSNDLSDRGELYEIHAQVKFPFLMLSFCLNEI